MNATPLFVDHLRKVYQKGSQAVVAVDDVSFDVQPGEIFGLLGPNGAGKTSIISTITTLERATGGDVYVFGESVTKNSKFTKKQLGVVPQEIVAQGFFNLEEILSFHSGYYGIWKNHARIEYLLKRLGLYEHRKKLVKQLSGGMKRRLMIAKALVHQPKLLLLDEPTAGVDIELRNSLWEFVQELSQSGVAILLTTHYLQEAEALCKRVGIIHKGKLQYAGLTKDIINKLTKKSVELTIGGKSSVHSIPHEKPVGELLNDLQVDLSAIQDIKIRDGTLEEAFLAITK